MSAVEGTIAPIKAGTVWEQKVLTPAGEPLTRRVEDIGVPTLSSPVNVRILRNDAHPHRAGKTTSIRKGDLRAKYRPVR